MEWDNLTYVEMGDVYYGGVAFEANMAIENNNVIEAQKVKSKVNKLMYACVSGEKSHAMMILISKYLHLDHKLLRFVLKGLRQEQDALFQEN